MRSARVTMADRSVALSALQAARGEVENRRSKLMKLRGTPGIRVRHCRPTRPPGCVCYNRAHSYAAAFSGIQGALLHSKDGPL